jgi:hypothetical protein
MNEGRGRARSPCAQRPKLDLAADSIGATTAASPRVVIPGAVWAQDVVVCVQTAIRRDPFACP